MMWTVANPVCFLRRRSCRLLPGVLLAFVIFAGSPAAFAQSSSSSSAVIVGHLEYKYEQALKSDPFSLDKDPAFKARQLRLLNTERQKQLVAETNRLLKLVQELNGEVSAANVTALTPAQFHKVAEIEKLANSIKHKMAVGPVPPSSASNLLIDSNPSR